MKPKFTPGPWTADKDGFIRANKRKTNIATDTRMALGINVAFRCGNHAPKRFGNDGVLPIEPRLSANGRLMADAPEMIELLAYLVGKYHCGNFISCITTGARQDAKKNSDIGKLFAAFDKARALVEKHYSP